MNQFKPKKFKYSYKSTYSSNPIVNPKFKIKINPKLIKIMIFFIVPMGLILYLIFFSPIFSIKNINIEGINQDSDEAKSLNNFIGKNIFLVKFSNIEKEFLYQNSHLSDILVIRGIPDTLIIKFKNKTPCLIWQSEEKNFVLDELGYPFAQVKQIESWDKSTIPIVKDTFNNPITYGKQIVSSQFIKNITQIKQNFKINTNLEIKEVSTFNSLFTVNILASNDWNIRLNLVEDINYQLANIALISSSNKVVTNYLDLRVPGYIYYK